MSEIDDHLATLDPERRAALEHIRVFPFSPEALAAVADRLGDFSLSKGTIRFSPEQPIPDDVLVDLVRHRLAELGG